MRAGIYSHMEAFVPCNKEALLKRLKKLSFNIQVRKRKRDLDGIKVSFFYIYKYNFCFELHFNAFPCGMEEF